MIGVGFEMKINKVMVKSSHVRVIRRRQKDFGEKTGI
jgi:hypothetical protein